MYSAPLDWAALENSVPAPTQTGRNVYLAGTGKPGAAGTSAGDDRAGGPGLVVITWEEGGDADADTL